MRLTLLTPWAALLALGVVVPLAALLAARARARRLRLDLGVLEPGRARLVAAAGAMVATGVFLGAAAAQPVVEQTKEREIRTDAEVFVAIDVSRSMLAQRTTDAPMRVDRAKRAAIELRAALPETRVGIASLTDRLLPHLFPSPDPAVFRATLERAIGIERPPPRGGFTTRATRLDALAAARGLRFFSPRSEQRVLVVFTDGESTPTANARLGTLFRRPPAIETIFVHVWGAEERVFTRGVPEHQYRSDPSSRAMLDRLAASTGGTVLSEGQSAEVAPRARELLGAGPTVVQGELSGRTALAPFLAAAALAPLSFLLWRRER